VKSEAEIRKVLDDDQRWYADETHHPGVKCPIWMFERIAILKWVLEIDICGEMTNEN